MTPICPETGNKCEDITIDPVTGDFIYCPGFPDCYKRFRRRTVVVPVSGIKKLFRDRDRRNRLQRDT